MDWNAFWNSIWTMSTLMIILEFCGIFLAKIVEVSVGTLRSILVVKGYRKIAVLLALVEISIWVFVASRVIIGLTESPYKGIAYALGFAAGVYCGSILEEKLAFGKILIQVITSEEKGEIICEILRGKGLGVTTMNAEGKDVQRKVLMIYTNRRGSNDIIKEILTVDANAMIVRNDISSLTGGHMPKIGGLLK
ncbi:MAG: DUF5698 domain-containing protein [Bacilli bacterium]